MKVLGTMTTATHPWIDASGGSMEDAALVRPPGAPPFVFTVDVITPIVDDPYEFGGIAAANSLSDVFAMGGDPQVALAVCGFPDDKVPLEVMERVMAGGRDKAAEAGCTVAGGHTTVDPELKYGLCVIGSLPAGRLLSQESARPGDRLVLTKPIGTGIVAQGFKKGHLDEEAMQPAIRSMLSLNGDAKDAALAAGARAATDVTGFGLLGHLRNMLAASSVSARLSASAVPTFEPARELAEAGVVPGGTKRNASWVAPDVSWDPSLLEPARYVLSDAQTSGGLLISAPEGAVDGLLADLERRGTAAHAVIGKVEEAGKTRIVVEP